MQWNLMAMFKYNLCLIQFHKKIITVDFSALWQALYNLLVFLMQGSVFEFYYNQYSSWNTCSVIWFGWLLYAKIVKQGLTHSLCICTKVSKPVRLFSLHNTVHQIHYNISNHKNPLWSLYTNLYTVLLYVWK